MFVLIATFKNMVVKFVGGCSVATRSYMIIHSMFKIYNFASGCGITNKKLLLIILVLLIKNIKH